MQEAAEQERAAVQAEMRSVHARLDEAQAALHQHAKDAELADQLAKQLSEARQRYAE